MEKDILVVLANFIILAGQALATDEISIVLNTIKSQNEWPVLAPERLTFGGEIENIFLEDAILFCGSLSNATFSFAIHHLFHERYFGLDPQLAQIKHRAA